MLYDQERKVAIEGDDEPLFAGQAERAGERPVTRRQERPGIEAVAASSRDLSAREQTSVGRKGHEQAGGRGRGTERMYNSELSASGGSISSNV